MSIRFMPKNYHCVDYISLQLFINIISVFYMIKGKRYKKTGGEKNVF
jgi:hypothetical protein